jgi:chemosensory pili system protein ChpA (sensor histidine kinase/response regulator)
LRSTASTLGFDAVAALATELEDGLLRLGETALAPEHRDALEGALGALSAMFASIRGRRMPEHDAGALAKLARIAAGTLVVPPLVQSDELLLERPDEPALQKTSEPPLEQPDELTLPQPDELTLPQPDELTLVCAGRVPEQLDARLLPLFLDEAAELLPRIEAELAAWRRHPAAIEPARALARALHTLKGSARMAGAMEVGDLIHALESQVGMAIESGCHDEDALAAVEAAQERIVRSIRALELAVPAADAHQVARAPDRAPPSSALHAPARQPASSLNVGADAVDRLVDWAGEISTARLRIGNEVEALQVSLHDLTDSVARLRSLLRETQLEADSQLQSRSRQPARGEPESEPPAFDPLELDRYTRLQELTRMMAESLHDVQMIQQALLANSVEAEAALALQGRIARDLQHELIGLRSLPFGALRERLQRTVRQSAAALGRDAELDIEGEAIELDRSLLQRLAAPLEHMLRNALAHGIEAAPVRAALGKPATGRIDLSVQRQGFQLVLTLADDGAGLDGERIRRAAERLGLLAVTDVPAPASLFELIFTPGLSTAPQLTESSGRGIGLDVARSEIAALGGSIEVASVPGAGATFRVHVPLALATAEVLLVRAASTLYAIPSDLVETVEELTAASLARAYAEGMIASSAAAYPIHRLSRLLGREDGAGAPGRRNAVLLLRSGEQRMALHVDEIVRNQEAVLKPLGPQLVRVPGLCGASVLGSNQLVLVIDPLRCAAERPSASVHSELTAAREAAIPSDPAHVMVVDDSLTVRRLSGRLLARAGYEVSTAKDGQDALQQMQRTVPELVVLDLEMPRMDGFELVRELRSDPRTATVPIVVVSSRLAEKHQRRAAEMGADAFFGKPYPEDELLACIAGLLHRHSTARAA